MNFIYAELRRWVRVDTERDTFQGYIYNDDSQAKDGTFLTVEADDVTSFTEGLMVQCKKHVYYLWNTQKRES